MTRAVTQLRNGEYFDLLDPDPALIDARDVAETLVNICRFNGRTNFHYSVLEHSFRVRNYAQLVGGLSESDPLARAALYHDAAEAFTGDIIQPVKMALKLSGCTALRWIEQRLDRAVEIAFHLPTGILEHPFIKRCDLAALEWERARVIDPGGRETPPEWPGCDPEFREVIDNDQGEAPSELEHILAFVRLAQKA